MGTFGRVGAVVLLGLTCGACAQAADVINDLSAVKYLDHYQGPDQGKELLKQNGFVVVQKFYHRISGPYADNTMPHYVTTDSVYNTFHVIFEELLKQVEADCAGRVLKITKDTRAALKSAPSDGVAGMLTAYTDAKTLADHYFQVAECLLSDEEVPADIPAAVRNELALIMDAAGPAPSPLFKYETDYSQFKPRGLYTSSRTLERYFRAMSWYGNMAFRVVDERESLAALMIAQALSSNEELKDSWARIDGLYSYLLAPSDDLTPLEYANVLPSLSAGKSAPELWAAFGQAAAKLRDPKINGMVLTPEQMPDWRRLSKGMHFFGKHYLPDGEAFMHLTDPEVPGRGFPSGLDVMAVNGSARAAELARMQPETQNPAYDQGIAQSKKAFVNSKNAPEPTHYAQFLNLLNTIYAPACPKAPAFAKTPAYTDKNLMTALSAWASMRHAWALHAKQSVMYLGGSIDEPIVGYVETNLPFFEAIHALALKTRGAFVDFKAAGMGRLMEFDSMVLRLTEMVKKEIGGLALAKDDALFLKGYALTVSKLQGFDTNDVVDKNQPWMALVSDIHSEMLTQECVEVGVGGVMPIYVIVERGGTQELMIGGVCSYYEFRQPIADRLTDETWRNRWANGQVPPMPTWTSTFVAGQFSTDTMIERIKKGENPDEAYFINDPKFCDFLESAVQPGSALYESKSYYWLLPLTTAKVGRKMAPFLLEQIRTANTETGDGRANAPSAAAEAFRFVVTPEDLPALKELMLGGDGNRSYAASRCLDGLEVAVKTDFLISLYEMTDSMEIQELCMREIGRSATSDVTPRLLSLWNGESLPAKVLIADALVAIWAPKYPESRAFCPPSQASDAEQNTWAAGARKVVLETLQLGQPSVDKGNTTRRVSLSIEWDELMSAAGRLKLEEVIPILKNARKNGDLRRGAMEGLVAMDTERSIAALIDLTRVETNYSLYMILRSLESIKPPAAVPRLRELLSNKTETSVNDRRVCDHATWVLKAFFPDGPGEIESYGSTIEARDAKVEEWRAYLDKKFPAGK